MLLLALAASVWLMRRPGARTAAVSGALGLELVSVVPPGPGLLVTADVRTPRQRRRPGAAARRRGAPCSGCASSVVSSRSWGLRRVGVRHAVRGDAGYAGDFALIAETSADREAVLACAEKLIHKRGGQPVRSSLGSIQAPSRDREKPLGEG